MKTATQDDNQLTKIGVFYDGNYFNHVSNYYNYVHKRKARLNISGLHRFITHKIADEEDREEKVCKITQAHYFRGRLSAKEASERGNLLYYDRIFDDILMSERVMTHYQPVRYHHGKYHEKGMDLWLALEALEQAFTRGFDVLVLIACDGDYVPLVRKLNNLGIRVMLISWDFEFVNDAGEKQVTRTSQHLLKEVSYPVSMHELIENRLKKDEPIIQNLFVQTDNSNKSRNDSEQEDDDEEYYVNEEDDDDIDYDDMVNETDTSEIFSIKDGFGFIKYPPNNLFFYYEDVLNTDFNDLAPGDKVEFTIVKNKKGENVATDVRLVSRNDSTRNNNIYNL